MTRFFFILFLIGFTLSSRATELCEQKKKQYGSRFISCQEVDFGVTPISSDYQSLSSAPMTAVPSQVKGYENQYPEIKNTRFYHEGEFVKDRPDLKGLPLASKFYSAVVAEEGPGSEDLAWVKWLSKDWYNGLQPRKEASGWEGKCATWSAWSLDPELQKLFSNIQDGILCQGIPFTKGELKEIVTALYPEPSVDRKNLKKFHQGYFGKNPDEVEDANVALARLGLLGQGDLEPAQLIAYAEKTKASGKKMMMDRDPGAEIWNQPIRRMLDVAYENPSLQQNEILSSSELIPETEVPESKAFLQELLTLEADLTVNLIRGEGIAKDRFCVLKKKLSEDCSELPLKPRLSEQAGLIQKLKKSAMEKHWIKAQSEYRLVAHEILIEYGDENPFASQKPDRTLLQSYRCTSIHPLKTDGSLDQPLRSQWQPSIASLGQICADPSLLNERGSSGITRKLDLGQKCVDSKPAQEEQASRFYFSGAVPPQSFKSFRALPQFTVHQTQQEKAYRKLLEMMGQCETFDRGVEFLRNLDQAALDNRFSPEEISLLSRAWPDVQALLDVLFVQSELDKKYQGIQGLDSLKSALKI